MSNGKSNPSPLTHMLETCLYVNDLEKATAFYRDVMELEPIFGNGALQAFGLGQTVLILFPYGANLEAFHPNDEKFAKGTIPPHGPTEDLLPFIRRGASNGGDPGPKLHYCFGVPERSDVDAWEEKLKAKGIKVTGQTDWVRGARSIYFSDPDGHLGEIACRGIWPTY